MSKNQPTNAEVIDTCTQRLEALQEHLESKAQIAIDGVVYKTAAVIAIYQGCLDSRSALLKSRATVKENLATRATAESARRSADRALKPWVLNQFGANSAEAAAFGFAAPKPGTRTAQSRADSVELALATRKARNTMGKKEKLKIRGTIVAPTAPAAPASNAQAAAPVASALPATVVQAPPPALNGTASH